MKYAFIDFDGTLVNLKTDHTACKKELCIQHYHEVSSDKYSIIDRYEIEALPQGEVILEASTLLSKLRLGGYRVVITSRSGRTVIEDGIKRFGLITPDMILSRDDVKFLKPDERHLTNHIKDYGLDSIVIGDSWHDSELASKLGLKYYNSVSGAMKGLGFRKSLHNDEVYTDELKFLKGAAKSPVLDAGCGNRRGGDICVDVVEGAADRIIDFTKLPFGDGSFNSVFFIHSLEHVESYMDAVREARRVLKPNGILGVVIPVYEMSFFDPTHKYHWHTIELNDIICSIGFTSVSKERFNTIFNDESVPFSVAMTFRKVG